MIKSNFSIIEKKEISKRIKQISLDDVNKDYEKLNNLKCNTLNPNSNIGNDVVDYFTFYERLNTVGKSGISYYDFLANFRSYKDKKYVIKYFKYLNKNETNKDKIYQIYRLYSLYFGTINIFKPLVAKSIYCKFNPKSILDFTMGWGGRLVGACSLNIPKYTGIDLNKNLKTPYTNMVKYLNKHSTTEIKLYFEDATTFDYSKLDYDFVLTSPPYYNIELYKGTVKKSIEEWNNKFYTPLFEETYKYMKKGYYCLNIPIYIYDDIAVKVLGKSDSKINMTKSKRSPDDKYKEFIYVWKK
jgi:hypothetical protein